MHSLQIQKFKRIFELFYSALILLQGLNVIELCETSFIKNVWVLLCFNSGQHIMCNGALWFYSF